MKSKVFFKKLKDGSSDSSINQALKDLVEKSGIINFIKKDAFTAIKMHFGEEHNEGHIKPQYITSLINALKKKTNNLFMTDANVIYRTGSRWNSVGHLTIAYKHGFDISNLGIPVIISDGLMGRSYKTVKINKKHFKEVKIGSDYFDADSLISLSHVTGHMLTSIAASIKNIGMGCASRSGKLEQHSSAVPTVTLKECTGCNLCVKFCPENAISLKNKKAYIDTNKCIGCGECTVICRYDAIKIDWSEEVENLQEKMVEYAFGVTKLFEKNIIFINFLINITKDCDCMQEKLEKITPDIGLLASTDPVAIDKASLDLVDVGRFKKGYPNIDWNPQFVYAEKLGLGTQAYELVELL